MFLTNLKIAYRNLLRNKAFGLINISGLAIGMACTILLLLWVNHELSYDQFHDDTEDIFQVTNVYTHTGKEHALVNISGRLIDKLKENYPEIEYATNFNPWGEKTMVEYKGRKQYIEIKSADPDLFRMFNFPILKGNPETCLNDLNSMVISEKASKQIFGDENPIGKVITVDNRQPLTITAVCKNIPDNSTLQFDYLIPFELLKKQIPVLKNWETNYFSGFAKIKSKSNVENLNERLKPFYTKYVSPEIERFVRLSPISKVHLYDINGNPTQIEQVRMFFMIALFILIIACFNFMNLSTARAVKRSKEIGLKKTIGATYPQLIRQFLGESLLLTFISINFALILVRLFLPEFNNLMDRNLSVDYSSIEFWLITIGVTLSTGIVAGAYPAFYLSSFNPIKVLKGANKAGKGGDRFRKVLVVFQFILASSLLIATLTIVLQMNFLVNMDMGLSKDRVITIRVNKQMQERIETIKSEINANPYVESSSYGSHIPYYVFSNGHWNNWEGKDPKYNPTITYSNVDADFIKTFDVKLAAGRFFNGDNPAADSSTTVINEKFARIISKESVIDKTIENGGKSWRIIGVVEDYHCTPLERKIAPFMLRLTNKPNFMFVRYQEGSTLKVSQHIQAVCDKYNPDYPLVFHHMSDNYNSLFEKKQSTISILSYASILAIFISCLGLFGLASFMAEERTKEIGVRKVLGASVGELIYIFSKEFSKWIVIASIISWPITYYALDGWFAKFAYRIDFPYWIFVLVTVTIFFIAIFTVAYQSWKSATRNPVVSLKCE